MSKEKLNSMARDYVLESSAEKATEIYDGVLKLWNIPSNPISWKKKDELSIFNEVFAKTLQKFKEGDFINLLSRNFKNARIDVFRKERIRACDPLDTTDDDALTSKTIGHEDKVIEGMYKKKEADQRQLIDFLSDRANDPVTTLIVTKFLGDKTGEMSVTAIAKSLGVHHETVKRKVLALSRHYDANRFGDVADYLAV